MKCIYGRLSHRYLTFLIAINSDIMVKRIKYAIGPYFSDETSKLTRSGHPKNVPITSTFLEYDNLGKCKI